MSTPEASSSNGELSEPDKTRLFEGRRDMAALRQVGQERRAASGVQDNSDYDPSLDPHASAARSRSE